MNTIYAITETHDGHSTPKIMTSIVAANYDDALDQFVAWAINWLDDLSSDSAIVLVNELRSHPADSFWYDACSYSFVDAYEVYIGTPVYNGQSQPFTDAIEVRLPDGSIVWGSREDSAVEWDEENEEWISR